MKNHVTKWSFLKNKQFFILSVFAIVIAVTYTNCSTYQDSNLFEAASDGDLGSVQTYENRLFSPAQGIAVENSENMINVNGECNIVNNTNHYIELRLVAANGANTPYRIREDAACIANPADPECFRVNVRCEYGRYNANLPVGPWVVSAIPGCTYFLRGQLVLIEDGVEKRENRNLFNLKTDVYDITNASCPW